MKNRSTLVAAAPLVLLSPMALPSRGGAKKAPAAPIKVEVRGTLRVTDKVEVVSATLARGLARQRVNATVSGRGMHLAFGDGKGLAAPVKRLDGKAAVITGEPRQGYEGPISGLCPPRFDDYIRVATLKAAE